MTPTPKTRTRTVAGDFDAPEFEAARAVLAREIDATGDKLLKLQEAYEALGGTYEDEDGPPETVKLLTGPRGQGRQNAEDAPFTGKQEDVFALFQKAGLGKPVKVDDIAGIYGGMKQRWYNDVEPFKAKLARQHGKRIVTLRGLGYQMEDL